MKNVSKTYLDFRQYIHRRRVTDTVQGDFTADAQRDDNLPNAKSWKELRRYFDTYPLMIGNDVYVAAKLVWSQYRSLHPAFMQEKLKE